MHQCFLHRSSFLPRHTDSALTAEYPFQQTPSTLSSAPSSSSLACKQPSSAARGRRSCSVQCDSSNGHSSPTTLPPPRSPFQTGGTLPGTSGGNKRLTLRDKPLPTEKHVVVVRHGLTTWNESKRIQGDSDEATLTPFGEQQAARVRDALQLVHFDSCFTSPIQRAARFADIIWSGRSTPLIPMDLLKEANLGYLQGMSNADAKKNHSEAYNTWRDQPADFWIDGMNPLDEVFKRATVAWADILEAEGTSHLLVTHKSLMRAMMCVALGLPTSSFRAVEIHNGGVSVFRINVKGEPMLMNMNMTAHMHLDGVKY